MLMINPSGLVFFMGLTIIYAIYMNEIINIPMKSSLVVLRILFSE